MIQSTVNTQLVDAIIQMISALSKEEQTVIAQKLLTELSEPSGAEIMRLSMQGNSFQFLEDEPNLYTVEDGEPIS